MITSIPVFVPICLSPHPIGGTKSNLDQYWSGLTTGINTFSNEIELWRDGRENAEHQDALDGARYVGSWRI